MFGLPAARTTPKARDARGVSEVPRHGRRGRSAGDHVGTHPGHYASWVFQGALGEMRGVFGVHVAAIAAMYGLNVEPGLESILLANDTEK